MRVEVISHLAQIWTNGEVTHLPGQMTAILLQLEVAQLAVDKLDEAGFAQDDAMAVVGQEVIELAKAETGVGAFSVRVG